MTEKEAIEILKGWLEYNKKHKNILREADTIIEVQETVLNLIQTKQEEIEKKDKIIDLIVNRFQQICVTPSLAKYQWKRICSKDLKICEGRLCEDCIIEYFKSKVEKENK